MLRLDKWLWCARLFKTRGDAASALRAGKVLAAGARIKPARLATPGLRLEIRSGALLRDITIRALSPCRVPAAEAARLYEESAASIERRAQHVANLKLAQAGSPRPAGRPDRRQRRRIIRFRRAPGEL